MNNEEANEMSEKDNDEEMSEEEAFQRRLEIALRIMEKNKSLFERLSKL